MVSVKLKRLLYLLFFYIFTAISTILILFIMDYYPPSSFILGSAAFIAIFGTALAVIFVKYILTGKWDENLALMKGVKLLKKGDYQEAITYFDRSLSLNSNNALAWTNKAAAIYNLKNYEQALECSDNALSSDIGKDIWIYQIGSKWMYRNKNPFIATMLQNKGAALGELGESEEALEYFDEALDIDPKCAAALCGKGDVFKRLGRYKEALEYVEEALEIESKIPEIWLAKGEILVEMQRFDEALPFVNEAIKLNPDFEPALKEKEKILSSKN